MSPTSLLLIAVAVVAGVFPPSAAWPQTPPGNTKELAAGAVDHRAADLIAIADQIWAYAETALREHQSAALLADHAEQHGFTVQRGVAGMPTAFVASFGSGSPVIGIVGEYDALPGLSQAASTEKQALPEGDAGHACGHNLFGAGSLGAAIAIKEQIEAGRLRGTIRFYGTPAEEDIGGKIYMAREGIFEGVDVMLAWHPEHKTQADTNSSQALIDLAIEFRGRASHAAVDPWNGRSAADALELFTHGINLMREHIKPTSRMHYTVTSAGDVPNVVPEYAKVWLWLRDWERTEVDALLARVRKLAEGAALMTETSATVSVQGGNWEMLTNLAGARLLHENLEWVGPVSYSEEEVAFARALQRASGAPEEGMDPTIQPLENQELEGGSSDVGDMSWVVPTLHLSVATAPKDVPWHAWPVVAASGMSLGHKGMLRAAKVLAATMVDLYEQPELLAEIRAEFETRKGDVVYEAYLPEGPPSLPQ